ncbi:MAG: hypothetical protein MSQ05_01300 [Akkermansia sp.]|nr:hypothetical protein [Akkermansia sp.]
MSGKQKSSIIQSALGCTSGAVVSLRGRLACMPPGLACGVYGAPEVVAGHACAGGGGTPAGREISRRWCAPAAPAVCLPALPVMVRACRRRVRGVLAPVGGVPAGA